MNNQNNPAILIGLHSPSYSRKKQGVIFDFLIKLVLKCPWPPAGEVHRKKGGKANKKKGN